MTFDTEAARKYSREWLNKDICMLLERGSYLYNFAVMMINACNEIESLRSECSRLEQDRDHWRARANIANARAETAAAELAGRENDLQI